VQLRLWGVTPTAVQLLLLMWRLLGVLQALQLLQQLPHLGF
jgi:hypothetical protein